VYVCAHILYTGISGHQYFRDLLYIFSVKYMETCMQVCYCLNDICSCAKLWFIRCNMTQFMLKALLSFDSQLTSQFMVKLL